MTKLNPRQRKLEASGSGPMRCPWLHSWRTYGARARLDGDVNRLQVCCICGRLRELVPGDEGIDRPPPRVEEPS